MKLLLRRSFVVRHCPDLAPANIPSVADQVYMALSNLAPSISFRSDPLSECLARSPDRPYDSATITLICAKGPNLDYDFEVDRTKGFAAIYLGRTFERLAKNGVRVTDSELVRLSVSRVIGALMGVVSPGDDHRIPSCVMQPARMPFDLVHLTGVSLPFCVSCQRELSKI
ncbi:hypothetical protein HY990_05745 [Candidatus Micrarchaeota archaeon]|nr:hypothetical protein [Candidatus Micrarchaeota archaeon]